MRFKVGDKVRLRKEGVKDWGRDTDWASHQSITKKNILEVESFWDNGGGKMPGFRFKGYKYIHDYKKYTLASKDKPTIKDIRQKISEANKILREAEKMLKAYKK